MIISFIKIYQWLQWLVGCFVIVLGFYFILVLLFALGFFPRLFVRVGATYRQKGNWVYYCWESQGGCLEVEQGREGPRYAPDD